MSISSFKRKSKCWGPSCFLQGSSCVWGKMWFKKEMEIWDACNLREHLHTGRGMGFLGAIWLENAISDRDSRTYTVTKDEKYKNKTFSKWRCRKASLCTSNHVRFLRASTKDLTVPKCLQITRRFAYNWWFILTPVMDLRVKEGFSLDCVFIFLWLLLKISTLWALLRGQTPPEELLHSLHIPVFKTSGKQFLPGKKGQFQEGEWNPLLIRGCVFTAGSHCARLNLFRQRETAGCSALRSKETGLQDFICKT